ncbi:MG284/MPN403 family protein [Mycoplasmoides pirum]|uniref:MG284/MPN403 family protein n=1 Tax=Mycoplasmoides pirum TaxID=2122 RepID=UPI000481BA79|nr:hypothetical protein [Mycoplasmoides pirum]
MDNQIVAIKNKNKLTISQYRLIASAILKKYFNYKFKLENKNIFMDSKDILLHFRSDFNIENLKNKNIDAFMKLINNALENLKEIERKVIESYYFENKNFNDFFYSKSWFYQLLNKATKNFCELVLW